MAKVSWHRDMKDGVQTVDPQLVETATYPTKAVATTLHCERGEEGFLGTVLDEIDA